VRYTVHNSTLEADLARLEPKELKRYLFLQPHPEFKTHFRVQSFDPFYIRLFYELIGDYQALSIWKLPELFKLCEEIEYEVVFMQDPAPIFKWIDSLDDPYPGDLGFDLKKFQTQGFNFLRESNADIVDWSTGTGKSVFGCAKAKYLLDQGIVDKVVVVSKAHARIGWLRQLKAVAGIDAELVGFYERKGRLVERSFKADDGGLTAAQKAREFRLDQYSSRAFIINYEKLKNDEKELTKALKKQRVYFIWDEMPTKLKSEGSALYRATRRVVRATERSGGVYGSMLSATAIENIPEDVFYCVKLLDQNALPETVAMFRDRYGKTRSYFDPTKIAVWDTQKLQELGLRLAHMTHKASKYTDPEIAAQFPVEQWEDIPVQMSAAGLRALRRRPEGDHVRLLGGREPRSGDRQDGDPSARLQQPGVGRPVRWRARAQDHGEGDAE
jgi:KaiC/GvpD/RAD55 family RecA-like ATPase